METYFNQLSKGNPAVNDDAPQEPTPTQIPTFASLCLPHPEPRTPPLQNDRRRRENPLMTLVAPAFTFPTPNMITGSGDPTEER